MVAESPLFLQFCVSVCIKMIQIGNRIVSRELFDNYFTCHLEKCEGSCCVYGDSGAPLEDEEADLIDKYINVLFPFMRPEGRRAVEKSGSWLIDGDGDKVTPLVGWEECAYACFEGDIARCAIEKAYEEGAVSFQKPVSCHLYPIRITRLKEGVALNYHRWSICEPARILGKKRGIPVFRFLEDAIKRVFGNAFYEEMELIYREINKSELSNLK